MRYTQFACLFNKRIVFSAVYSDLVDFVCGYEPTLKLYAKHTCESVVVVFPFVQRRSAPSAKILFVLCSSALVLACLSRKHMAPHMWRCHGGLSEQSSSFWSLQLTTNPDSKFAIPLFACRAENSASLSLARTARNPICNFHLITPLWARDKLVLRACLRAFYREWTIKHNKR